MNRRTNRVTPVALALTLGVSSVINALSLIALAEAPTLTRNNGAPVGDNQNSQTAGPTGPTLLQDVHLIEKLAAFDRERIPERVVHARGVGAHGEFESYTDLSALTRLAPLQKPGLKTPVFVRFSTVINASGSPETLRDPRGFATRFYTESGNWDLVGNNLPVFFIRDAIKFADMVHSLKPSPVSNVQDPNRWFDFFSHQPESTHMLTFLYSDQGTPASLRTMDGFGVHAYKLINAEGKVHYAKFHWKSNQGLKTFTAQQATEAGGQDFNLHTNDLRKAIAAGNYPSWDLMVQVLEADKLNAFEFNPLDATKIWPTDLVPEVRVGKLTLNKMPQNYFNETERFAPSPANLIPGIEPSEDRLLQGRLFSYTDTQRYRLGVNGQQLPINMPLAKVNNHNQAGEGFLKKQTSDINYQPSISEDGFTDDANFKLTETPLNGTTQQRGITKTLNFKQAGELYRSFTAQEKTNLVSNFSGDLKQVTNTAVKNRITAFCYKADADYGSRLAKATGLNLADVQAIADTLAETLKE
ncbi:MAG: catalase [Vampirovibrionales bacterium]|nr:catalase [Vampirovibrionales bacterium]